jgi:hypothetical protein
MEDLMLGDRRTIALWKHRQPRLLALERALAPSRAEPQSEGMTLAEQSVVGFKAVRRMAMTAKQKAKIFDSQVN